MFKYKLSIARLIFNQNQVAITSNTVFVLTTVRIIELKLCHFLFK